MSFSTTGMSGSRTWYRTEYGAEKSKYQVHYRTIP